jgi:hypothetical protein
MTRIVEHLSVAELERRYRAAQEVTEARHTQAIWLLAQGRAVLDVAGVLGGAVGGALQRARPCCVGRPAAAQRTGRQRAD